MHPKIRTVVDNKCYLDCIVSYFKLNLFLLSMKVFDYSLKKKIQFTNKNLEVLKKTNIFGSIL